MKKITSVDGTHIGVAMLGDGPALVLVHGTGRTHAHWAAVLPYLAAHSAVYAVDRRGRGESGAGDAYALAREVDDIRAVLETIDGPVHLLGHSFGAIIALELALQSDRLSSLVLYEPPLHIGTDAVPADLADRLADVLAAEQPETVLETFLREGPRYSEADIAAQRAGLDWPARVASAHTLPRELDAVRRYRLDPTRVAAMTVPTCLIVGSESPPFFQRAIAALHAVWPNSEVRVLPGHHHNAMETGPELFAQSVHGFLRSVRGK
jgi:pimeloyl-ACP methyl ester carboxylesterase